MASTAVLAGGLLFALTLAPEEYRAPLLQKVHEHVSTETLATTITALKVLFGLGVAKTVNNFLNRWAQNNWQLSGAKYDWPKEIAFITGGGGGFGLLIGEALAKKGVTIIAVDILPKAPERIANNPKIHYYKCDVTDRQAIFDLKERVVKEHGDVSILLNNAGIASSKVVVDSDEAEVRRVYDINTIAHYWTVQAFLPTMLKKKHGHIVTVASVASFTALPRMSAYNATKAAALAFHETLNNEIRHEHKVPEVKTTVVHPFFAKTGIVAPFEAELKERGMTVMPAEVVRDAVVKQILSGRGNQLVIGPAVPATATPYLRSIPTWIRRAVLPA